MKRVGLVGWRGMVGSVLMQRMHEERDFALIEPEGEALLKLFRKSCPLGQYQFADCDGILLDVAA